MYNFSKVNNLDDIDFNYLFSNTIESMDSGTIDWEEFSISVEDSRPTKYNKVYTYIQEELTKPHRRGTFVTQGDLPLMFSLVVPHLHNGIGYTLSCLSFTAPNANGSKSWIYSDEFMIDLIAHEKDYNSQGRILRCKTGQAVYNYVKSRLTNFSLYEISEDNKSNGISDIFITFKEAQESP